MNRIAFIVVPAFGIALWLGAATFTITHLESMSKSTSQLKSKPKPAPTNVSSPMLSAGR
ncbi:MAG: hypothetical protein ACO1OB_18650 [Archangium sp.]